MNQGTIYFLIFQNTCQLCITYNCLDNLFIHFSKKVDQKRMRKCLITELETLAKVSGIQKISSIFFGGGELSIM